MILLLSCSDLPLCVQHNKNKELQLHFLKERANQFDVMLANARNFGLAARFPSKFLIENGG